MKKGSKSGYVYILSNATMPGIVKIGKTTRPPAARLREINSATGVAMPFRIEAVIETKNPSLTEGIIHNQLSACRINQRREFFKVSVTEATDIARRAAKRSKGKIFKGNKYGKKTHSHFYGRMTSTAAIFTWSFIYSPAIAVALLCLCLWAVISKTPRTIWEALSAPSHFGRTGIFLGTIIAIYPVLKGQIDITLLTPEHIKADFLNLFGITRF